MRPVTLSIGGSSIYVFECKDAAYDYDLHSTHIVSCIERWWRIGFDLHSKICVRCSEVVNVALNT